MDLIDILFIVAIILAVFPFLGIQLYSIIAQRYYKKRAEKFIKEEKSEKSGEGNS